MKALLHSIRMFLSAGSSRPAHPRYYLLRKLILSFALCSLLSTLPSTVMAQFVGSISSSAKTAETTAETTEAPAAATASPSTTETSAPVAQSPSRAATGIRFGDSNPDSSSAIDRLSGQVSQSIFVPNNAPVVTITGGNKTIADTDNVAGELVVVSGTATDSGGIASTQWLINDAVVATGTSATIALSDGITVVSFKATDNSGSSATKSVTYTVIAPTFHLPRIKGVSNLRGTSGSEFTIAFRDPNNFPVTISPVTQSLAVNGYIFPQDTDENFVADLFVVAVTPSGWYMRNLDGGFVRWNGRIADLAPAFENRQLTAQVSVPIFTGKLPEAGTYRFYVGYMRVDSSELIYTANAATLTIIP